MARERLRRALGSLCGRVRRPPRKAHGPRPRVVPHDGLGRHRVLEAEEVGDEVPRQLREGERLGHRGRGEAGAPWDGLWGRPAEV